MSASDFLTSRHSISNWKFEDVALACSELSTTGRGVQNVAYTTVMLTRLLNFVTIPISPQQFDDVFSRLTAIKNTVEIILPVSMYVVNPRTGSLTDLDIAMRKDERLCDYLCTNTEEESDFTDSISVYVNSEDGQRSIKFTIKSYFR